jgi:hypothetical protein
MDSGQEAMRQCLDDVDIDQSWYAAEDELFLMRKLQILSRAIANQRYTQDAEHETNGI